MAVPGEIEIAPIEIAPMRRGDLPCVLDIETKAYPRPWTEPLFLSELALRSSRSYFVARVEREIVGSGGIMLVAPEAHVTTLAVASGHQRERIGTALLVALAREAVQRGTVSLTLEVRVSNTAAQELYRRFGFAPVGVRKGYYPDSNEDAIVMWVHDVDRPEYATRLRDHEAQLRRRMIVERDVS